MTLAEDIERAVARPYVWRTNAELETLHALLRRRLNTVSGDMAAIIAKHLNLIEKEMNTRQENN